MERSAMWIVNKLINAGYEAFFVGGCVRDRLIGRCINDFDIATNALPEEIKSVFSECMIVPTGIRHGTLSLIINKIPFEVTTYRVDGKYSDNRHPDSVRFSKSLKDDLSRRDFTINALAMDINGEIVDLFDGTGDIKNKLIRCVGLPEKRFAEDSLRIMRAVRFASQLGFTLEQETDKAVHNMKERLKLVSSERVSHELDKLICGENCVEVLLDYSDVIAEVIPEISPCIGFDQHSDYHCYNVWEHTVRALAEAPVNDLFLRRALLFHDLGKPLCAVFNADGKGHFKRHANISADMAVEIMKRLHYDSREIKKTESIIRLHSQKISDEYDIKKLLNILGEELFFTYIEMRKCDNSAKREFVKKENPKFDTIADTARKIISSGECYKLSQLEINGDDLINIGLAGKEIGNALSEILQLVMQNKLENDKNTILNFIGRR